VLIFNYNRYGIPLYQYEQGKSNLLSPKP